MTKSAIVIGSQGQDGKILFDLLVKKKYSVIGLHKTGVDTFGLNWKRKIDITESVDVFSLVKKIQPNEIYHLAAFHHSSQDKPIDNLKLLDKSYHINFFSLVNFLEAVKKYSQNSRIFYASSALIFGTSSGGLQDETTPFAPDSFYGFSKLDGLFACKMYRETYGIFASTGILFNHESAYRDKKFISRKIIQGVIDIKNKKQKVLKIGDLTSEVDWGYAPDYMEAVHTIMSLKTPDDFIIATGKTHSVLDLIKIAFGYFGLDWKKYVIVDPRLMTRKRKVAFGNTNKLTAVSGWKPRVNFEEMIVKIIKDLDV